MTLGLPSPKGPGNCQTGLPQAGTRDQGLREETDRGQPARFQASSGTNGELSAGRRRPSASSTAWALRVRPEAECGVKEGVGRGGGAGPGRCQGSKSWATGTGDPQQEGPLRAVGDRKVTELGRQADAGKETVGEAKRR